MKYTASKLLLLFRSDPFVPNCVCMKEGYAGYVD